jgi:hypothetical protein
MSRLFSGTKTEIRYAQRKVHREPDFPAIWWSRLFAAYFSSSIVTVIE